MPIFSDNPDHLEDFIAQFERIATDQQLPIERWATNLSAVLSPKAREAFFCLPPDKQTDYESVKKALFQRYQVTARRYQKQFKEASRRTNEPHMQFLYRLQGLFDKWVRLANIDTTFEDLRDAIVREQMLSTYREDLTIFLAERDISSLEEMAQVADRFEEAHENSQRRSSGGSKGTSQQSQDQRQSAASTPPHSRNSGSHTEQRSGTTGNKLPKQDERTERKCFMCGRSGHIARECWKLQANTVQHEENVPLPTTEATINGKPVTCLLDTGLTLPAMVDPSLVTPADYTGVTVKVRYADGRSKPLPLVMIGIESEFVTGTISAVVQERLPFTAVIGCRYIDPRALQEEGELTVVGKSVDWGEIAPWGEVDSDTTTEPEGVCMLQQAVDPPTAIVKKVEKGGNQVRWKQQHSIKLPDVKSQVNKLPTTNGSTSQAKNQSRVDRRREWWAKDKGFNKKPEGRKDFPKKEEWKGRTAATEGGTFRRFKATAATEPTRAVNHSHQRHTLFVSNLPYSIEKRQLRSHFRKTGRIRSIRVPMDKGGTPRGFAYIECKDRISHGVVQRLDHTTLGGRRINVEFSSRSGPGWSKPGSDTRVSRW